MVPTDCFIKAIYINNLNTEKQQQSAKILFYLPWKSYRHEGKNEINTQNI